VLYEGLARPVLFRLGGGDAETAHDRTLRWLVRAERVRGLLPLLRRWYAVSAPREVFGLRFPNPVGLAAGVDKNGVALPAWPALGFGFVEVGTVTPVGQPGNPRPRLVRLPDSEAIINRMGFNNEGAPALADRLARGRPAGLPIGISLGKSRSTPVENAVEDYLHCLRLLYPFGDYFVVNVSSPNTPGLRDLQAVEALRPILAAVKAEASAPVLVKIAPDLSDADVDEIADLAVELGLAGIVATNTTVCRGGLATPGVDALGPGGISGPPVAQRSAEVLRRLYNRVGERLVLISVGGIETADDAWHRITSGASLLQGYTGFVYGGGLWPKRIHDGIARRLRDGGFTSLADAVGSAMR
jgi:dihydroorotate dehydrogenase